MQRRTALLGSHDEGDDDSDSNEETHLIQQDLLGESEEPGSKGSYPKSVFFIIGNEFCERFSYYGMRTILTLYLTQTLFYGDDMATMIFHIFSMACYFTPVLGAIIADSWLGKFKTIFYISIIYAIGNIMISVGSIPQALKTMNIVSLIGLGFIALGTGGIKPCVSAFGGDQFEPGQELYLQQFFSFFYMSINLGSMISTFLTPVLRSDVKCFGQGTCFPVAFGVPAILMILSLVLFLIGKPLYKINPPQGNVLIEVGRCVCHAVAKRFSTKEKKRDHWLDYADDKYEASFIEGIKTLLRILLLYLPLPVFWALFDQQGSKWTLQAVRMDGRFFGYTIKPDQMQVFNPLLVIFFIPMFEYCIYPVFRKCNFLVRPLQRITVGGLLAALSFILAGFLQIAVEKTMPVAPAVGFSETTIINNSPCNITISGPLNRSIGSFQESFLSDVPLNGYQLWQLSAEGCGAVKSRTYNFTTKDSVQSLMIAQSGETLDVILASVVKEKVETGNASVSIMYSIPSWRDGETSALKLVDSSKEFALSPVSPGSSGYTMFGEIPPGNYKVCFERDASQGNSTVCSQEAVIEPGGVYILSLYQKRDDAVNVTVNTYVIVEANTVHILYQVPQYLIITAGEIMFSITGLEFSYSQAPKSLKSVLQAAWLLTVAFGDLIVVIVAKSSFFEHQSREFFMYAALMILDMLVFAVMAVFYKYVNTAEDDEKETAKGEGKVNQGYVEDTKF